MIPENQENRTTCFDKIDFFNLEDLDLIIKFLYVKAKVENNNYEFYKKLYEKAILRFFGGVNDGKTKISEFIESFDELIESIETKGFDEKYPIILSKNNMILNGRHRLAVCMYFDIEPTFKEIDDIGHKRFVMNLDFYSTVFSCYEVETIITDYLNNFKDDRYFVTLFWGDSEKNWKYIEEELSNKGCILSYKKLFKFKDKKYFENVLEGIYVYENGIKRNGNIFIKTEGLKDNMKFKFILFKYEGEKTYRCVRKGFPICVEIEKIKLQIREGLSGLSKEKNYSFLHTSDNYDHTRYLCNFLFNDNLKFLRKISKYNKYINRTNKFLTQFHDFLTKNNVDRYDFCFESGIILQIFGIRKAADLDFICLKSLRNTLNSFPKDVDLHEENRFYKISMLTDDAIVKNRDNYFFYKGFKFISPDLLIKNTSHLSKKKNLDMQELQKFIDKKEKYKLNVFYKIKVAYLLKYYWLRRRITDFLTMILSTKQKYLLKKFLNKHCGQNYNIDHDSKV